jgi:hypothetical protein
MDSLALPLEGHSDTLRRLNRKLSGHQNYFTLDTEEKIPLSDYKRGSQ